MKHDRNQLALLLGQLDLGKSIAEQDNLLNAARVETSVFTALLHDHVDLIPGTKGSGKSALYRIFVDGWTASYHLASGNRISNSLTTLRKRSSRRFIASLRIV